jgi:hypothetical protein
MALHWRALISRVRVRVNLGIVSLDVTPPEQESTTARQIITRLEDRRFLFSPFEKEDQGHVIESVLETREWLGKLVQDIPDTSSLYYSTTTLRAACREFLDCIGANQTAGIQLGFPFILALGELRAQFGQCIAELALTYHIDVPDSLVGILPPGIQRIDKPSK